MMGRRLKRTGEWHWLPKRTHVGVLWGPFLYVNWRKL